jgi:hypothetical protein
MAIDNRNSFKIAVDRPLSANRLRLAFLSRKANSR